MTHFIELKNTYNPLTTQGEGRKYVNIDHIIHITDWSDNRTNKRIKTIKTRIKLSDGEIIEVSKLSIDDICKLIKKAYEEECPAHNKG